MNSISNQLDPTDNTSSISWMLGDFRSSAVPDRLTLANAEWIEGEAAVQVLSEEAIAQIQRVKSFVTAPARRIQQRYQFAGEGGWVAYGCDLNGNPGTVAYFKPIQPREATEFKGFGEIPKVTIIKYETPGKTEATPILPWVDSETAQKIYQRYGVEPPENETFWQAVKRCNLPVAIVEGLKKALSLMAHGIPAVALRGIHCWHRKGTSEMHEAIAHFATPGRKIHVAFDQDEKASTQRDVRIQVLKLGAALEGSGCKVDVLIWDRSIGKGIDDVLYRLRTSAQTWLNNLLQKAPSLKTYRRLGQKAAALSAIERLNRLSYPVERETQGEYLPTLPALQTGAIHVLDAEMGSGKTTRIGQDWVKGAIAQGWNVLVLCPLNSLGQQTANQWDLPHVHHFGTSAEQQSALWSQVSHNHGIVMCPESLHRLPNWFWNRPVFLILDESNQTIEAQTQGDTLGSRWADILERLTAAAQHAIATGAIVLSEDGIPDRAVDFIKAISGSESVRVFRHRKQGSPWDCTVFSGQPSGFRARSIAAVKRGDRLLFVTSSQREAKRLERALACIAPERKVIRIDSETNQQGAFNAFFDSPDSWLEANQPDVLILSPSGKSGISIQGGILVEDAYFSSVWGYFPFLSTDTHAQLLGRYRPTVPRFIFVPQFILVSADESLYSPRAIKRRLGLNLRFQAGVYELGELLEADGDRAEAIVRLESAILDYLAVAKVITGSQKSIAHDALVHRLESSGHSVRLMTSGKDKIIIELWKEVQEQIWREEALEIASSVVEPENHSPEWAYGVLDSLDVSLETRTCAFKVLWREEFPGVDFDDAEDCYQALCQDYGSLRRGVILQAKAENLDAAKEGDRAAVESIFKSKVRAIHRLPTNYVKALLISKLGVLALLDGNPYTNDDPRAIAIKETALRFSKEIYYWLRLQIKPSQSPVEIANKFLKKLKLEGVAIARPGRRGEHRDQVWQVAGIDSPVRARLLEAARRKLSESVSSIRIKNDQPIQINDTEPKIPPEWDSPVSLEEVREWWEDAGNDEARESIRKTVPFEVLRRAIAS